MGRLGLYLQTALVVLLRHLQHPQLRPSFIVFWSLARYTIRRRGEGPQRWSITGGWGGGGGFQLLLFLFNQIQQDDPSACFLTAIFLCFPVTPSAENSPHPDCSGNLCNWSQYCPTFVSTLCQEFIIFHSFSFIGLSTSFFPWNCQLDD